MAPILFLDIDGVLLGGRAWILPENDAARAAPSRRGAARMRFDPCAVALVNRLHARSGARVVVHSSWRHDLGLAETRARLLEEGIDGAALHADWACPHEDFSTRWEDIRAWLAAHVPAGVDSGEAGFPHAVLDDETCPDPGLAWVPVDPVDGLTAAPYRVACALLGGVDPTFGVHALSEGDMGRVLEALRGDRVAAARFLFTADGHDATPSALLAGRAVPGEGAALRRIADGDAGEVRRLRRQRAWDALAALASAAAQ